MAEGSSLKNLEERAKKLESKLSILEDLPAKLEETQKETEDMKRMMQTMMEMMKNLQMQHTIPCSFFGYIPEFEMEISPSPRAIETQTSIPTENPYQKTTQNQPQTPSHSQNHTTTNSILPILQTQPQMWPQLEFSIFEGTNPRFRPRRCSKMGRIYEVLEEFQVETSAVFLEVKSDQWFQEWKEGIPILKWDEFVTALCFRYGEQKEVQVAGKFHRIKQIGLVKDYPERFENLKSSLGNGKDWLEMGNPWEMVRNIVSFTVKFYGGVIRKPDGIKEWITGDNVYVIVYNVSIPGCKPKTILNLQRWSVGVSPEEFDLQVVNVGDHAKAYATVKKAKKICDLLFPENDSKEGKTFHEKVTVQEMLSRHIEGKQRARNEAVVGTTSLNLTEFVSVAKEEFDIDVPLVGTTGVSEYSPLLCLSKAKGEPLLKKSYGEDGGDDIDFDCRQLTSSDCLFLDGNTGNRREFLPLVRTSLR